MTDSKLSKYKNPPINEVVLGVTFKPLEKMKAAYIGLFWNIIKNDFPKCEQAPVVGNIDDIIENETGLPIPRTWLINKEEDLLIQIQRNKFIFNWRKKDKSYPHFNDVSGLFFKYLKVFSDFITINDLGSLDYNEFELTYVNNILKGEGWEEWKSIDNLFPDLIWNNNDTRFLSNPEGIVWQPFFSLPEKKGQLVIKVQPGFRRIDNYPLIIFEISAKAVVVNKSEEEIRDWFNFSHEFIIKSFEDLTSSLVQDTVWGKIKDVKKI